MHDIKYGKYSITVFYVASLVSLVTASTPAPQQTSSSDCPHSQASDPPTDHSPDPEGHPSNAKGEDQSVSAV